jgi:hypothetical protein
MIGGKMPGKFSEYWLNRVFGAKRWRETAAPIRIAVSHQNEKQ